nr:MULTISPECIES: DUF4175 family protein [Myxococcaceae]
MPPPPSGPGTGAGANQARVPPRTGGVARLLAAVRARQRRIFWLQGALLGLAAGLVLALAGALLSSLWLPGGRALLALAPLTALGLAALFGLWRAARAVGDDARTARRVGEARPELSLDVLAAVELQRERAAQEPTPDEAPARHSAALADAFLAQMDARADGVDARGIVEAEPARRAGLVLAAALLLALGLVLLAGGRVRSGLSRALQTQGAAGAEAAPVEPITGDIELTYRYPAYTGLAPRTVPGTTGEVSAPAGTEVALKTRSDRPVARAELVVNGEALPLQVSGGRELTGSFVAKKAGHYHFVFSAAGASEPLAVGPDIALNVEADAPPQVTLLTPAAELEVDPGQKVTLKYEATDDYGLSGGLALVYRLPGRPEDTRVALPREDSRRARGQYTWDLGQLPGGRKLQPGDRISYYVEAKDNDAVEGPKRGVSRTQTLRVYSASEHRREALQKAEQLWNRMVDHLADRLEAPERAKKGVDPAAVGNGSSVDARGQSLVEDLRALSQALGKERDAPAELVTALQNISQSLGQRVRATAELRKLYLRYTKLRGNDWGTGNRLASTLDEEVTELERDVLYLESLLDRTRLQEIQELAQRLSGERRELSRLIEQFKASPSEAAQAEVMRQIESVRQRMQELAQRMSELRQGIRDEHLNAEALEEMMKEQDVSSSLDDVEKLMREGKADEALAKLQQLSQQMDEMMQGLDDAGEDFGSEQYPELAEKYGKFMKDLDETAQKQQQLSEQTRKLRDAARERSRDRLGQKGQALKDELLKDVSQAQKGYAERRVDELSSRGARPLEEVQNELQNVENALKANDFDLAAEAAQRAQSAAEQLSMLGQQQRELDVMWGNPPEVRQQSADLAKKLRQEGERVSDVSRKLQSLFPPPGSQLSAGEKDQLKKLAGQQQQLGEKAQSLREQMEEMEQMAPLFGEEAGEQMEGIGQKMGDAAQRMAGQDPQKGYGEQQGAMEALKQFQQAMKESQRGRGKGKGLPLPMAGGQRRQGNGRDSSQEKVELPDADAYQAPKEFRQDLLDAMKQGAPEKYKDQVKRYYEELVK